jgi:hypothetical protein
MSPHGEAGNDATKEAIDATTTERTLKLLDSEIEHIRGAQTKQGWTSWGLLGAIVGSLWLLSDELKAGNVRVEIAAIAVLLFSTLADSLRWLVSLLWLWKDPKIDPARFKWSNEFFSGNELLYALEILRSIGLLVVVFVFAPKSWLPSSTMAISYVWYLIMAILWLVLTQAEFPIRQGFTKKGFTFILAFIVPCLTSFFLYLALAPFPTGEVIASYRAGGLLVGISYLILSLAIVTKDSPILHSLIGMRRNIVFNRVDINSAVSQAEIALKGMEVPDAIQKDVSPILALVERLDAATSNLMSQVQTMQTHLPTAADSQDTISAKLKILTAHRNTCDFILRDRESNLRELNSKFQQLMKRRQRIQGVIPEAVDFFNQFDRGMKTILEESDLRFNQYVEQANKYDEQLEAGKRAAVEA